MISLSSHFNCSALSWEVSRFTQMTLRGCQPYMQYRILFHSLPSLLPLLLFPSKHILKYILHLTVLATTANVSLTLNEGSSAIPQSLRKIFTLISVLEKVFAIVTTVKCASPLRTHAWRLPCPVFLSPSDEEKALCLWQSVFYTKKYFR